MRLKQRVAWTVLICITCLTFLPYTALAVSLPSPSLPSPSLPSPSLPSPSLPSPSLPSPSLPSPSLPSPSLPSPSLPNTGIASGGASNQTGGNSPTTGNSTGQSGPGQNGNGQQQAGTGNGKNSDPNHPSDGSAGSENQSSSPVSTIKDWVDKGKKTWKLVGFGGILPSFLASYNHGYKIVVKDGYAYVKGQRFLQPTSFYQKYIKSARVSGTRYLDSNTKVSQFYSVKDAARKSLNETINVGDKSFWKSSKTLGGPVALGLTLAGDVYDYSMGEHKNEGVVSTGFASSTIVDVGLTAGSAVVSSAAGAFAGGIVGAEFGSVVPVVGTAVGFVVGIGITVLLNTSAGKRFKTFLKSGVKKGLDWTVGKVKSAYSWATGLFH